MATIAVLPTTHVAPSSSAGVAGALQGLMTLGVARTANGFTDVLDRQSARGTACTYQIEGSFDGVVWFPHACSDPTVGPAMTSAPFTIVAPATLHRFLDDDVPACILRVVMSANTGMTNTIEYWEGEHG